MLRVHSHFTICMNRIETELGTKIVAGIETATGREIVIGIEIAIKTEAAGSATTRAVALRRKRSCWRPMGSISQPWKHRIA